MTRFSEPCEIHYFAMNHVEFTVKHFEYGIKKLGEKIKISVRMRLLWLRVIEVYIKENQGEEIVVDRTGFAD